MVTGVGGGGHGEQILKALRLADTPYHVLGSDMSPYSTGLAVVDQACLMPPATDPDYIATLLGVCQAQGIEVLFHGSEPELKAISAARDRFTDAGILVPINPAHVIETCLDKVRTMEELERHGFPVPAYRAIRSEDDAESFDHLPAVLKPSVGGGGSANLFLVQDREEMRACARQLLSIYPEFIAQAYVGTPEDEYTAGVLFDLDGNLINSIAIQRSIMSALSNRIKVTNRCGAGRAGAGAGDLERRLAGPHRPLPRDHLAVRGDREGDRRAGPDQRPVPASSTAWSTCSRSTHGSRAPRRCERWSATTSPTSSSGNTSSARRSNRISPTARV